MERRWGTRGALLAVVCAAFVLPATAQAAPGDLKFVQCLDDLNPGGDDCARSAPGLEQPADVAVSPDGRSVYVAAFAGDSIVHLRRNKRTGKLRKAECIENPGAGACPQDVDGLDGAAGVAVHPNGRHVYVVSIEASTLLHFRRNRRSGKLRLATCIDDADLAMVDDVCPGGAEGLGRPQQLAVSPDGRSLYVVSASDSALVHFQLHKRSGKPRFRTCFEDDDKSFFDDCPNDREGLFSAQAVGVSPNGRSVYVASWGRHTGAPPLRDGGVVHFKRNRRSGALRYRGCIVDNDNHGDDNCGGRRADGIREATSLGISPDGRFMYVGVINGGSFGEFRLRRNGQPRYRSCVEAPFRPAPCATTAQGIGRSADFAFDSRGRSMYVSSGIGLQPFVRAPRSGILTERPCIDDVDAAPTAISCQRTARGLLGASGLAMSPDDRFLYVAAANDNAVTVFRRKR